MAYKEVGAAGERLNAGDLNEMINKYHMKAKVSFSNKKTTPGNKTLVKANGNTLHFLLESVERYSVYNDGSTMPLFGADSWQAGGDVPADIQNVLITRATDSASFTPTVINIADNLSNRHKLAFKQFDDYYVIYWYTYTMLTVEIPTLDTNNIYFIDGFVDSTSTISSWGSTTLRVSYGSANTINTPYAVQNKDLALNMSFAVVQAFDDNPMMIFDAGSDGSKDWSIRFDRIFIDQQVKAFKLLSINDDAVNSGITISSTYIGRGGLTEIDHTVVALSGSRYLHKLIYYYQPDNNEFYEDGEPSVNFRYFPAILNGSNVYNFKGAVLLLPNSSEEFGYGTPKFINSIASGAPLTNILLSYMYKILKSSIYRYGPQNYTVTSGDDARFTNNTASNQQAYEKDGIYNTYLTQAGAFYHLSDMTNFNDEQEVSWNIQYIK